MSIESIPKSPIEIPHPNSATAEFIFDSAALGKVVTPSKEMVDIDLDLVRFDKCKKELVNILLCQQDNQGVINEAIHINEFKKWFNQLQDKDPDNESFDEEDDASEFNWQTVQQHIEKLRYNCCGGVLFESTSALDDALDQTDIGANLPVSLFKLPYPNIYIRFGEGKRGFKMPLARSVYGSDVFVDGCYLREFKAFNGARTIAITTTMRAIQNSRPLTTFFNYLEIPISNEDKDLDVILDESFYIAGGGLYSSEGAGLFKETVCHIVKLLLYMKAEHSEQVKYVDRTEALSKYKNAGTKKQHKLAAKVLRTYDRIVLGNKDHEVATSTSMVLGSSLQKTTHWRRGHFRNQAHGEGRVLRKLVWVKPVLVNSSLLGNCEVKHKDYLIANHFGAQKDIAP